MVGSLWRTLFLVMCVATSAWGALSQIREPHSVDAAFSDENSHTAVSPAPRKPDFNQDIYYKDKLELSLENGWLPINIPFVYNFLTGDTYTKWPLSYTLAPNIASLRWQIDHIDGPSVLRGNSEFSFSFTYTDIPRGPETRYFAFDFGIRRNFVPRSWRVAPYFEMRGGVGNINAKGPDGILYAQGQDLTFTYMMGSGARYNFSPRFSVASGLTYMHVSNGGLSNPKVTNFGINVYGPIVGFYARIGKARPSSIAH